MDSDIECIICYELNKKYIIHCGQKVHIECLEKWDYKCPICKISLQIDIEIYREQSTCCIIV
jgi:hypothetical protein